MNKTVLLTFSVGLSGDIGVTLHLQIVDGTTVLSEQLHRAVILPGDDPAAIRSAVEAQIADTTKVSVPGAPWPAIPDAQWAKITSVLPIVQTADVIAAYKALMAALAAA